MSQELDRQHLSAQSVWTMPPTASISWTLVGITTIICALLYGVEIPLVVQFVPLLLSIVVLGLPHGAVDHLAPFRLLQRRVTPVNMMVLLLGYILMVALYGTFWRSSPGLAFLVFLLMTLLHWGQGDLYYLTHYTDSRHIRSRVDRALVVMIRGGLPMIIPVLVYPVVVADLAGTISEIFGQTSGPVVDLVVAPSFRAGLAVLFAAILLVYIVRTCFVRKAGSVGWKVDLGEIGLLACFFVLVPPWLAIGIYFCGWHALRHIYRLLLLDPLAGENVAQGAWQKAAVRFARDALLPTVAALLMLAVGLVALPQAATSINHLLGFYLALIAALTFPHFLLVGWMDWYEHIG